ncbi:MAG: RNA polymerase sigma factor [Oscillospiraceae bacterium]|nr:RNA polymerase sigma factor [Oscillospiraceae bacterium]
MLLFCSVLQPEPPERPQKLVIDEELFVRIGREDPQAFEQLYRLTEKAVYAYALSILRHPADAQDVMMETYLRIRECAHLYRPMGKPLAWIFTIVRNLCLMKLRAGKRLWDREYEDLENDPEFSCVTDREDRIVLSSALQILDETEREIVLLHAVSGLRHQEIARSLSMNLSTVLSKYHRSLKKLKKHLLEQEGYHA